MTGEFQVEPATIDEYVQWTECAAFRFVRDGDTVRLQISHRPSCKPCSAKGYVVQVGPGNQSARLECRVCGGTGREPEPGEQP